MAEKLQIKETRNYCHYDKVPLLVPNHKSYDFCYCYIYNYNKCTTEQVILWCVIFVTFTIERPFTKITSNMVLCMHLC